MSRILRLGWLFLLVFAVLLLVGSSLRDLWNPDEPRFAQVGKEMLESNEYIVPTRNGEVYTDKPPAYFWISLGSAKIFSNGKMNSFTARFPSTIAALLSLLLVVWMGNKMFGAPAGWFAMFVLATTHRFWWQAAFAQLDMLLTFFIFSALCSFWFVRSTAEQTTKHKFILWSAFYFSLAGGFLTKGPIGILIPCGIIFFFLLWEKSLPYLLKMWIPLGLFILLAIGGSWVWGAYQQAGSEYLYEHFIRHNFIRYTEPWGHIRPIYYYLYNFPFDCLPWIFFLPLAIISLYRQKKSLSSSNRFLIVWFALIFLFFSLSSSKRNLYLLPLYPAMALFLGNYFSHLELSQKIKKAFVGTFVFGSTAVLVALLVVFPMINRYKSSRPMCEWINNRLPQGGEVASYNFFKESFLYYLDSNIKISKAEEIDVLIQFLKKGPRSLALVQDDDIESVRYENTIEILQDQRIGSHHYYLVQWQS